MHGGAEAGGVHVVVVGATGRDLVLRGDEFPDAGSTVQVSQRIERLGGKGANQAVGLRQLHARHPASRIELVSVVGVDAAGDLILDEARDDGIGVDGIARRGETSLFVDVVAPDGDSRVFEHIPGESLLRQDDIAAAAELFTGADAVVLQLQQPAEALLAAAALGVEQGALVVLDGAIAGDARDELLAFADVVRSDAHEAEVLTGRTLRTTEDAAQAATALLGGRTKVVAFGVDGGDLVVWAHGEHLLPHGDASPLDPTGAGDAFVAGLTTALLRGDDPFRAGQLAAAAAASTVGRLGGRPDLEHLAQDPS